MKSYLLIGIFCWMQWNMSAQTFTREINTRCGDTTFISNLGYPTWNVAHILKRSSYGHASLLGDFIPANILQYIAPPCFLGRDTVVVECAHATQITCDTGIYVFNIACETLIATVYSYELDCRDSIYANNLNGWSAPVIADSARFGRSYIVLEPADGAGVFYQPPPGFEGVDAVKVALGFGAHQDTLLYLFRVYCDLVSTVRRYQALRPLAWPNPVSDVLHLEAADVIPASLRLWNVRGQTLIVQWDTARNLLHTADLPMGVYFLTGRTPNDTVWQLRFVKR